MRETTYVQHSTVSGVGNRDWRYCLPRSCRRNRVEGKMNVEFEVLVGHYGREVY